MCGVCRGLRWKIVFECFWIFIKLCFESHLFM